MATIGQQLLSPEVGWYRIDTNDKGFVYSGIWTNDTGVGHYNGSSKLTNDINGTVKFAFKGTGLRFIGYTDGSTATYPSSVKIKIDGVESSFSLQLSAIANNYQRLYFEKLDLSDKQHLIEISSQDSKYIFFDAIDLKTGSTFGYQNKILISSGDGEYLSSENNLSKYGVVNYKMNEGGTTLIDSLGYADGTINGATFVNDTEKGMVLNFDGNDYVQLMNTLVPLGKKSIKVKVKTQASSEFKIILTTYATTSQTQNGIQIGVASSGQLTVVARQGSNILFDIRSNKLVTDNQWHDVLLTWDGTTDINGVRLFIDNMSVPDAMKQSNGLEVNSHYSYPIIGTNHSSRINNLVGQLANLEIYNEVINPLIDNRVVKLTSASEGNFIEYGLDKSVKELDMTTVYDQKIEYFEDGTSTVITSTPFTLADEFEGKQIKILEYTDNPSQVESNVETEVEPYSFYDEFGNTMDVLYYTDDTAKTKADLEITANYSPLDELVGDFEVVTWSNAIDEVVQESIPQVTGDVVVDGTIYETPLDLENVVKVS